MEEKSRWLWLIFMTFVILIVGFLLLFFFNNGRTDKYGVYRELIIINASETKAPPSQPTSKLTKRADTSSTSEAVEVTTSGERSADASTTPVKPTKKKRVRSTSTTKAAAATATTGAGQEDSSAPADLTRHNDRLFCVFSGGRKNEIVLPDDGVCKYIVFDSVSPVKYTAKFTSLNSGDSFDAFMRDIGKFQRSVPLLSIAKHAWDEMASKEERDANSSVLEAYARRGVAGFGCALYYHTIRYAPDSGTHLALLSENFRKMVRPPLLSFLGLAVVSSGRGHKTRKAILELSRNVVEHVDLLVVVSHVPADQDFLQETEGLRQCLVTAASAWNADQLGNKNLISIEEAVDVIVNIKDAKARLFMSTTLGVWKYAVSAHSAQFTPTLHNITCDSRKMVPYAEVCRTNLTPGDGGRKTGVAYDYDARKSLWRWYETPESIYFKVQRAFKDLKDAHATDKAGFWAIYDVEMDDWDGECRSGVKRKPARLYRFADLTE